MLCRFWRVVIMLTFLLSSARLAGSLQSGIYRKDKNHAVKVMVEVSEGQVKVRAWNHGEEKQVRALLSGDKLESFGLSLRGEKKETLFKILSENSIQEQTDSRAVWSRKEREKSSEEITRHNLDRPTVATRDESANLYEKVVVFFLGDAIGRNSQDKINGRFVRSNVSNVGISGTESAAMLTLEYLAKCKSSAKYYYVSSIAVNGSDFNGVHYLDSITEDVVGKVTTYMQPAYIKMQMATLQRMASLQRIVLVGATYLIETAYDVLKAAKERGIHVQVVHLNEWSLRYMQINNFKSWDLIDQHSFIPNPVYWDLLNNFDTSSHRRKDWIFHALFERGGDVSAKVFCQLQAAKIIESDAKLNTLDYHFSKSLSLQYCDGVKNLGSVSKPYLYELLSKSKYFLYLLVLPKKMNYSVHKDTFAVSVLEAVLLGVRVVAFPVGPLPLLFQNLVDFVPIQNLTVLSHVQDFNFLTFEPSLASDESVSEISKFIAKLDAQDFNDERIRRMRIARQLYSETRFMRSWSEALFNNDRY